MQTNSDEMTSFYIDIIYNQIVKELSEVTKEKERRKRKMRTSPKDSDINYQSTLVRQLKKMILDAYSLLLSRARHLVM